MGKKKPGPKGPHRTKLQREIDFQREADLYIQGWNQQQIANAIGISRQQINVDLGKIRDEWRARYSEKVDEFKQEQLAKIDALEAKYWAAWEKSLGDKKINSVSTSQGLLNKPGLEKTATTESSYGESKYLDGILKCIDRRCKILGIDAPKNVEMTNRIEASEEWIKERSDIVDALNAHPEAKADMIEKLNGRLTTKARFTSSS